MPEPSTPPIPRGHLHLALGMTGAAALGAVARYLLQGTGNIYTNTERAFYLEDPVLGWSATTEGWLWLGVDALAIIGGVLLATVVLWKIASVAGRAHLAGRLRRGWLQALIVAFYGNAAVGALAVAVPVIAFASGLPPHGAEPHLPRAAPVSLPAPDATAEDAPVTLVGAPAGRYSALPHERANTLNANIAAGGESFDAQFAPVTGEITLDPTDLRATHGRVSAPAASIDTGIALRSSHARADLAVDAHPEIALELVEILRASSDGPGSARFEASGLVEVMGRRLTLPVTGTVKLLDAAERSALSVEAPFVLLVNATLTIPIAQTPLDASSFDRDTIPVAARLLLAPAAAP